MQDQFKQFEMQLLGEFTESHPKLTLFPSDAAMLEVAVDDEMYVLEYHVDVGLGINRMSAAVFGWEGYERPYGDFAIARQFLVDALHRKSSVVFAKPGAVQAQ